MTYRQWTFSHHVSIHAPARGATLAVVSALGAGECFNSRTREGCDRVATPVVGKVWVFQFTHPRGVRRRRRSSPYLMTTCFNSRTREGCDRHRCRSVAPWGVSIHAPARGATANAPVTYANGAVSIHAPARGATPRSVRSLPRRPFQFTHPRGVRPYSADDVVDAGRFQFTHPRGVRHGTAAQSTI